MEANLHSALHQATTELINEMPLSGYVEAIADGIFESLQANVGATIDRGAIPEKELIVTPKALIGVWTGLQLMVHLAKIYEAAEVSDIATTNKHESTNPRTTNGDS